MGRVVAADVTSIIDTDLDSTIVDIFISTANVFVTDQLSGEGHSDDLLKEIERWVTAHLIAVSRERELSAKEAKAGSAEILYTGSWGQGLSSTSWGQVAISLDSSDTLKPELETKKTATIRAVTSFD
jgi:hypothetical protein